MGVLALLRAPAIERLTETTASRCQGFSKATVDGQVREERLDIRRAHFVGMNPLVCAIVMKSQKLLDRPAVGLDCARG